MSTTAGAPPSPHAPDPIPLPRSIGPSTALLLLRIPLPPEAWPAKLELASPLLSLASRVLKGRGVVVNAVWDGVSRETAWPTGEEVYPADIFWPDGHTDHFEQFSAGTVTSAEMRKILERKIDMCRAIQPDSIEFARVASTLSSGPATLRSAEQDAVTGQLDKRTSKGVFEILVCTHGSRDCRCGDTGGALVIALNEEIGRRGLQGKVKVGEVAHVGGHKYAANAIVLPSLDMLSNLLPSHAPHLLSWLIEQRRDKKDPMWAHWRGRYGLTEVEQAGVWGSTAWAHEEEKIAEKAAPVAGETPTEANGKDSTKQKQKEKEEVRLRFKTYEGEVRGVTAFVGESLLDVGKREDLPAIEGVCKGNLECATCHLYLPPSAPVPEAKDEELDMLGYALGYKDGESRLGCQIKVTKQLAEWAAGEGRVISLPRY